jgi:hypothetical protein
MTENSLVVTRFGQSPQKRADGWLAETTVAWRKAKRRLGWHWLFPLCLLVLLLVELHTVHMAFSAISLGRRRWDWGGLFSLKADGPAGTKALPACGAFQKWRDVRFMSTMRYIANLPCAEVLLKAVKS